jgi:2-keto-3-deoxy-L-rhamnonate aldolase RhmA
MASVDGVDFLFLGPGDFSVLGGFAGRMDHPAVQEAVERIARAAKNTGKHWGCPVPDAVRAREIIGLGGRIIAWGSDIGFFIRMLRGMREEFDTLTRHD